MAEPDFTARNARVAEHYTRLAEMFGDSPKSGQWRDMHSIEKRLAVLFDIADLSSAKVLDFGCGIGHLYDNLTRRFDFTGDYVGYDISVGMLTVARVKHPKARFERVDIFANAPSEKFDYVLANGIFNNRVGDPQGFLKAALPRLFALCRRGLAFNLLSAHAPGQVPDLIYFNPASVFDWVRSNLGPMVTLRQDYLIREDGPPEDFTLYVRRAPAAASESAS